MKNTETKMAGVDTILQSWKKSTSMRKPASVNQTLERLPMMI